MLWRVRTMSEDLRPDDLTPMEELALATLLEQHYGDGLLYLYSRYDRLLFKKAARMGLVDAEGYLTQAGYRFWNTRRYRRPASPKPPGVPPDDEQPPEPQTQAKA